MKFGTILTPHWDNGVTQSDALHDMVERAIHAERCGFWSCWTTEHHFANDPSYAPFGWPGGNFPAYDLAADPLTLLTYIAARTTTLRLGTGVLVMHYDNPLRVAERAAMLDILSGGRLELGLGRGSGFKEPPAFHVPEKEIDSQNKFFDEIDLLLKAWSGEWFSHETEFFSVPKLAVVPNPVQRPHPPVYLSSGNPRSVKYAAEHGLSLAGATGAWGYSGVDKHNITNKSFIEAAAAVGRDVSEELFPNTLFLFCAETDREAEEVAEQYLMRYSAHVEGHYERQRRGDMTGDPLNSLSSGPGKKSTLDDIRELARAQIATNLIGSPATICEKLTALLDRVPSINYVLGITDAGTPPKAFVHKSMELFTSQVMPKFADRKMRVAAE
jgi:alkanesulfonate monooxygenase SsuD/methylene tetrahydromethanopterin reductase-like flavin-dependent oxidoreductase (luciferase family)